MATRTGKRKAWEQPGLPEKRARVGKFNQAFEIHQLDDDESENDQEDTDDDESLEDVSKSAETPNTPLTPHKNFPSNLKTIKCTIAGCTKSFNRPSRLANHLKAHNNERTFFCTYDGCDKSYFEQKHLAQHIKGSHTHERSYKCNWEGCPKSFLTNTRLRRHIETHEGQNRFKCTAYAPCNQEFRKHQTLQRHIRSDHLQLSPYPCRHVDPATSKPCNAGFDGAVALHKHEDRVHSLPQFFCPNCTVPGVNFDGSAVHLGFTTNSKLQNHVRKEHAHCPFCERKCSSQRELQKHVESQHSGKPLEERKNIPCTYEGCDKTFTKKYNRDVHVRTQHEGSRFICGTFDVGSSHEVALFRNSDACGKDFVSKANLEDHIRTTHLGLPSHINSKRRKSVLDCSEDDEVSNNDFDRKIKHKMRKSKGKKAKPSAIDDLLGLSYTSDSRRNIPCPVTNCPHLFIREYDLQQHMRIKHHICIPKIEKLSIEEEKEVDLQFASTDFPNERAYEEEGREKEIDWSIEAQDVEDVSFWFGGGHEEMPMDQWAQDEFEMRRLIEEESSGNPFDSNQFDAVDPVRMLQ